jgi:hypothetical protein
MKEGALTSWNPSGLLGLYFLVLVSCTKLRSVRSALASELRSVRSSLASIPFRIGAMTNEARRSHHKVAAQFTRTKPPEAKDCFITSKATYATAEKQDLNQQ